MKIDIALGMQNRKDWARVKAQDWATPPVPADADYIRRIAAGEQLARAIPGAWLLTIKGVGHDIPLQLCGLFVDAIAANAARA
jgi:hypothetical protein